MNAFAKSKSAAVETQIGKTTTKIQNALVSLGRHLLSSNSIARNAAISTQEGRGSFSDARKMEKSFEENENLTVSKSAKP